MGRKYPLEKGMATHSGILAWKIPWIEEPGGLQSIGLKRVGHDRETNTENPQDAAVIARRGPSFPAWPGEESRVLYQTPQEA